MHPFHQIDVFTDELTRGNPVAVVHDADDLTTAQMAALARWTNLSETTFLLTPTAPADYRVRIFTPGRELPFAGHPTLGSARAWLEAGGVPRTPGRLVQQCGAGPVELREAAGRWSFGAPPLTRSGPLAEPELSTLAAALGVGRADVVAGYRAVNGPHWVIALLPDADAVLGLRPDAGSFGGFVDVGAVGPYPAGAPAAFEVRAFVREDGVFEDPVTGSLNGAVAQWLIPDGRAPERYTAAQGTRLGRRGRVHIERIDGQVWVGGDTTVGLAGTLTL